MDMNVSVDPIGKPDFIARYFLRRLAMAHRERPDRKPRIQYTNAFVETILIFVAMPMGGLASVALLAILRWAPQVLPKGFGFSQMGAALALWSLSVVVGYLWLGPRLKKYREDPSAYIEFATTRDARVASWQRFIVFTICAIVLPLLILYVRT